MPFDVRSPVTPEDLAGLDDRPQIVQFSSALTDRDYQVLAEWFASHPNATLRVYAYDGSVTDLEFLRWFPTLTRFHCDVGSLMSLDGLHHLPEDAESLVIGATRSKVTLKPLARFMGLKRLYLEGHTKDFAVVSGLTSLVDLILRSITLASLEPLQPLTRLRALDLKLGGTTSLTRLPTIGRLEYLELWQIRGLSDIDAIAGLPDLRYLFLQSLRRVERLPSFTVTNCTQPPE